ncbi:MAG: hypothetical protein H0X66_09170 [Verrucomicrobia bacterium]|nr:hypothetical protein [Verrucomicrobiota bacterium]
MRFKKISFLVLVGFFCFVAPATWAFSLLGPLESWQTRRLNYDQPGDIGGWMNRDEEYRWNTPIVTYGFDSSFINYFGTNGVKAIEEGIAIFNALPPASQMNLDDFPLESQRFNYRAQSLQIYDIKSFGMHLLLEEMGLADPDVGVWRLRERVVFPGLTNYHVIQRNFDPYSYEPTPNINGKIYTYSTIIDIQDAGPPIGAYPLVEPLDATEFFASGAVSSVSTVFQPGAYFSGFTRDDAGGLKYLLQTNNYNVEELLPDVRVVHTNLLNPIQLLTLDLAELLKQSQNTTNTVADLYATNIMYTNLWITGTNASLGALITTNRITYFTNYPANPVQVIEEIYTTNIVTLYNYEFGNVVIYDEHSERPIYVRILDIVPALEYNPFMPTVQTNVVEEYFDTEFIRNGEFFIMPTNLVRFVPDIFSTDALITNVVISTNTDFFAEAQFTIRTNTSQLELLLTTDLTTFFEQSRTNDPGSLLGLYPDLLILSSNRYFTNIVSSNYVAYLTNSPWDPAVIYSIDHQWFFTTNIATNYNYVFGNVVTNFGDSSSIGTNATILVEETIVAPNPYDPAGSPFATNVISSLVLTNVPVGSIYIVPTNLFGYQILSTQLVDVVSVTNTIVFTNLANGGIEQTNTVSYIRNETNYFLNVFPIEFVSTNDLATNIFGIRREVYTFATNRIFEVYPVGLLAPTNSIGLRPGIDKLTFVRVHFDSLVGAAFLSVTNEYVDTVIVSNQVINQVVRRTATHPDIVFSANDLNFTAAARTDTGNWIDNSNIHNGSENGNSGLAGPGVIFPRITITFNRNFPMYFNYNAGLGNQFLNQPRLGFLLNDSNPMTRVWGSFDGSTNAPIIYPTGSNLQQLEDNIFGR